MQNFILFLVFSCFLSKLEALSFDGIEEKYAYDGFIVQPGIDSEQFG